MTNTIEDSLNLFIDLKKLESLRPGFLDDDLLECVGDGFDSETGGFWHCQPPSFQKKVKEEDEENIDEFFEVSNLTVRNKSTLGFTGS